MTTIITASGAAEFLRLVPAMLGYTPTRSVVVIPFNGGRSMGAMRFDLPDGEEIAAVAATMMGYPLRLEGVKGVAVIVYSPAPVGEQEPLLRAMATEADKCGVDIVDLLYVAADGWGSLADEHAPHPLAELDGAHPEAPPVHPGDQASAATLPEVTEDQREQVTLALADLQVAIDSLTGGVDGDLDPQALASLVMLDDLPSMWDQALEWEDLDTVPASMIAMISWCLVRPSVRDVGLITWTRGLSAGDTALQAQMAWEEGLAEYPADLAMTMWGEGGRPDPVRLEAGLQLCRHVAALSPDKERVGALSMAGWLSWALGRSSHAAVYVEQALAIEPEHGLSEIVQSFITAGHLPAWAFEGKTS